MLTRKHAQQILSLPNRISTDLVLAFQHVFAPEEVYFPTLLRIINVLQMSPLHPNDEILRRNVTFAEWEKRGDARPVQYPSIACGVVSTARKHGSVFARKFTAAACPVAVWMTAVRNCEQLVEYSEPSDYSGNSIRQYGVTSTDIKSKNDSTNCSEDDRSSLHKRRRVDYKM